MSKANSRTERRAYRHLRVRRKLSGTSERPRMSIMVSNKYIQVQFVDDDKGVTVASVCTKGHEDGNNKEAAGKLGARAVTAAREKGIKQVVVDRGGFQFHGRVKAVVDEAVKAGLVAGATAAVMEEK